jgi:heme exporter protein D
MSEHVLYVAAAYGATVMVIGALIGWILVDQAGRRREIAELEAEGIHRRSEHRPGRPA